MKSLFTRRRLRVDILTIFISLFLCTVIGIIYYSHKNSSEAILKVGNELIDRTNESIIEDLDHFLRPTPFINIASFLLGDEYLQISDMESLSAFMHIILDSYPQLTNVYLADMNGNMFIENHVKDEPLEQQVIPFITGRVIPPNTHYLSEIIVHTTAGTSLTLNYKNEAGLPVKSEQDTHFSYDPRTRPWFIGAQNLLNEPWIGVYKFYGLTKQGITISFPIYANKKLVGIAAADLNIDLIENELKKYSISNQGIVFIINSHQQLIANGKGLYKNNSLDDMPTVSTINNPLISTAYQIYKTTGKNNFSFTSQKIHYIANFKPYGFSKSEHWDIVTILPDEVFIGSIQRANQNTLFFSTIMLILGLVLIIFSSHKISKPIIRLAHETRKIIKFRFDEPIKIKTHIYEIQVMIDALNTTKSALSSFSKYVPKVLVEQLLQNKIIAQVGGKKQNISILFTDIANFTQISEQEDPELLMIHFSEYLNTLTQCIQQHHGNIDKYIGDAIMAFWGAPLDDPDHVMHACEAILACKRETYRMNEAWAAAGKPVLLTRFGLHTGIAIVGNLGSSDRLNYTAIGDTVNIAARLETLNKTYGTDIIVSEAIYEACADKFLFRPIDNVKVRGRKHMTAIYELIAKKAESSSEQLQLSELTFEAYNAYHRNDIASATKLYTIILEKFPNDEIAQIYLTRCAEKS